MRKSAVADLRWLGTKRRAPERLRVTVQGTAFVTHTTIRRWEEGRPRTLRVSALVLERKSPFHSTLLMITILVVLEREGSRSESVEPPTSFTASWR